jgi:hypothetical protein
MSVTLEQTAGQRIQELREEYLRVKAEKGASSGYTLDAFNRLSSEAGRLGFPLSGLRYYVADEAERFFARTLAGTDGHTYWDGEHRFPRNDGRIQAPRRWWWERTHPGVTLANTTDVWATCGEKNCITPEHCEAGRHPGRTRHSESQILGGLQVLAMRLSRTPSRGDWNASGMRPTSMGIVYRFGSWSKAITSAGLAPVKRSRTRAPAPDYIGSLCFVRDILGRLPSQPEFLALRPEIRKAGLPTSLTGFYVHFGSWGEALRRVESEEYHAERAAG